MPIATPKINAAKEIIPIFFRLTLIVLHSPSLKLSRMK